MFFKVTCCSFTGTDPPIIGGLVLTEISWFEFWNGYAKLGLFIIEFYLDNRWLNDVFKGLFSYCLKSWDNASRIWLLLGFI
jgi:hypothetical protein